jgi:hypothetical protein
MRLSALQILRCLFNPSILLRQRSRLIILCHFRYLPRRPLIQRIPSPQTLIHVHPDFIAHFFNLTLLLSHLLLQIFNPCHLLLPELQLHLLDSLLSLFITGPQLPNDVVPLPELLLPILQCLPVHLHLGLLLRTLLLECEALVLAVVLILQHRLDVRPHLLLVLLPVPHVLLQVQLQLGQLLVVLVELPQVSVGLSQ